MWWLIVMVDHLCDLAILQLSTSLGGFSGHFLLEAKRLHVVRCGQNLAESSEINTGWYRKRQNIKALSTDFRSAVVFMTCINVGLNILWLFLGWYFAFHSSIKVWKTLNKKIFIVTRRIFPSTPQQLDMVVKCPYQRAIRISSIRKMNSDQIPFFFF